MKKHHASIAAFRPLLVGLGAVACVVWPQWGRSDPTSMDAQELTAGPATAFTTGRNAFSMPLPTLDDAERARFAVGNSFFRRNWVEAPASTTARDGLGPHFIARSCGGCHVQDGRGAPPDFRRGLSSPPIALLIRLSIPGIDEHGGVVPDPVYGDQLNNAAIQGVRAEGQVHIRYQAIRGKFSDGTRFTLQKPHYSLTQLAYGPLSTGAQLSPRVAPHIAGVGLLEAIAEQDILSNATAQAASDGPIKGQPNYVWDSYTKDKRIGRFGWKANQATLIGQTTGAFLGDMGITSSLHPQDTCTPSQKDCLTASSNTRGTQPEIDDRTLSDVVFYQATLAPAARRNVNDTQVLRGQAIFNHAQCATCHRPSYTTASIPFQRFSSTKLQGLQIWPYTDMLLHDMGADLADGRPDYAANGRQWKTPPLWGIGLIYDVNGHRRLLHDGRANGVLEAILWHGGEALASKNQVLQLNARDRAALVAYVESL